MSRGRSEFPRILALAAVAVSSVLTARAGDSIRSLYEETYGRVDEARLMSRMERRQDKRMPEAWDGSVGRLTLLGEKEEVIADYVRATRFLVQWGYLDLKDK